MERGGGKKYIIIDTCVIQAAGHKKQTDKSKSIAICLEGLSKRDYNLAISEITAYKNLQGLWGRRAKEAVKLLQAFESKEVNRDVLLLGAMLGGLYHDEQVSVSVGDTIIAATAVLLGGFVLTENQRDFPPPFFTQLEWLPIHYVDQQARRDKTIDLGLLKPNIELIGRRIHERENESY